MKLYSTQNNKIIPKEQYIIKEPQNQNLSYNFKLGFTGTQRNCAALQVQGNKFCNSCNNKK